jgi:hypothetical protein
MAMTRSISVPAVGALRRAAGGLPADPSSDARAELAQPLALSDPSLESRKSHRRQ